MFFEGITTLLDLSLIVAVLLLDEWDDPIAWSRGYTTRLQNKMPLILIERHYIHQLLPMLMTITFLRSC